MEQEQLNTTRPQGAPESRYRVARGRSLMVHVRGPQGRKPRILTEGEGVVPAYFADGELRILELVDRGVVVDMGDPLSAA